MDEGLKKEGFDWESSPIKDAYILLDAKSPFELSQKYTIEDQKLMKSWTWDYKNPDLVINKVKNIIESVGLESAEEAEQVWGQEILWFWYHHAISCSISKYKDSEAARFYAAKAIENQPVDHPNKITKLLDFLVNDNLEGAEKWAAGINMEPEKSTAIDVIGWYKEGKSFS